ncbi:MAG: hypothetical protein Q8K40_06825, partial [Ignavibacteria bacterium]|nr:hypothetical protein [Ignavibacteria bacterium]
MKKIAGSTVFFILLVLCFDNIVAQTNIKNTYGKIERKLVEDKNYLDTYSIMFQANAVKLDGLQNIPRTNEKATFNFNAAETYSYEI